MFKKFLRSHNIVESEDFSGLYTDPPISFSDKFPEVPKPEPKLTPRLLAAQWVSGDLRGEDMPSLAADLLESGLDTPALRRLAGEDSVHCSADVKELVGKMFRELRIPFPLSERDAKFIYTRQIAREVIAGKRNAWTAASHLEIVVWGWDAQHPDLSALFQLNDEIDWEAPYRRPLSTLSAELFETFARLGTLADGGKRPILFGLLEGKGWIADDFDAPLPDELLAQFEGLDEPPAK